MSKLFTSRVAFLAFVLLSLVGCQDNQGDPGEPVDWEQDGTSVGFSPTTSTAVLDFAARPVGAAQ